MVYCRNRTNVDLHFRFVGYGVDVKPAAYRSYIQCGLTHKWVRGIIELEYFQCTHRACRFVDRVDPLLGHRAVGSDPMRLCLEPQRALVSYKGIVRGRLRYNKSAGAI